MTNPLNRTICLAPMMEYTDRHFRYLLRLLSRHMLMYTEMVHCGAVLFGDTDRFLRFDPFESPIALQLGGNQPEQLAKCAIIAQQYGYDEVNLNIGCPSDRVQSGRFGACLMADPQLVADCVGAMSEAVSIPVTVKNRTGIDKQAGYDFLLNFIQTVSGSGCTTFMIHARKAWLEGLSPKQNRDIPPLEYEKVYQLKADFPELEIIINGGISDYSQINEHLSRVNGVMIGRKAYENPYYWNELDHRYFGADKLTISRDKFVKQYCDYIQLQLNGDVYLKHMAKHLLNFYNGQPGARAWRRYLSENMSKRTAGVEVIETALQRIDTKLCA